MPKQNNSGNISPVNRFLATLSDFIKRNWSKLLVFFAVFVLGTAVLYLDANTAQTIASYSIEEYEPGQIADRTIVAAKTLPPDEQFPIAIEEGEKVTNKGFFVLNQIIIMLLCD